MNFQELITIFGGPFCAFVALVLFGSRRMRPKAIKGWLAGIAMAMVIPFCLAVLCPADSLVMVAFVARPLVALAAVGFAAGYSVLCCRRRLPLETCLPPGLTLAGAVWDLFSMGMLGPIVSAASC